MDLSSQSAVFSDLFSRIDLIPLETNDTCLLIGIDKLMLSGDDIYVFDSKRPALYVFDESGEFSRQISRKGDGPGEYQLIYDFTLDRLQKYVILLSPYGYLQLYEENGRYIEKKVLHL